MTLDNPPEVVRRIEQKTRQHPDIDAIAIHPKSFQSALHYANSQGGLIESLCKSGSTGSPATVMGWLAVRTRGVPEGEARIVEFKDVRERQQEEAQ